ncbi:MAG: tetratricopeptide repeat protein [Xanthomonadaceae bacterium]|nr:tetratricopeptide repeat protein [Xanthomonadaceae bacterium]MDP2186544.1 tetratricopeptide repeat protein [Xanthomonadales bacterium]MDZ4116331.1 tetratricopeptide repeat protein [Xanthomonadaceae bacterium]MDZ4378326.1 tetratricopeptide repeat protein [Xanthomonadaceae bacterium]
MMRFVVLMLFTVTLLATSWAPAVAQDTDSSQSGRSKYEDRGVRKNKSQDKEEKAQPLFPLATREDPTIRLSSRDQRKIQKLLDLSQGESEQQAEAQAMGEDMLANPKVTGYTRAFVSRVMADIRLEQDDVQGAIHYLQTALDADALSNDQHFQTMLVLAQTLINEDRAEEGIVVFDRLIAESKTDNPDYLIIKANALYQLERYPEALELAKQLVAASPEPKPSWQRLLVALYAQTEQPLEAAKVLKTLIAADPTDKALRTNLAGMYQEAGDNDAAVAVLNEMRAQGLLTTDRDYRALYSLYANIEGHDADVIAVINEGLEKGILEENVQVYTVLAQSHYFSDQIPQAIEAYKKASEIASDGAPTLNLARIYATEGRMAEAKATANEALAKGLPAPGHAWVLLGQVEHNLGNRAATAAAMKEAAKYPETKANAEEWLRKNKVR